MYTICMSEITLEIIYNIISILIYTTKHIYTNIEKTQGYRKREIFKHTYSIHITTHSTYRVNQRIECTVYKINT